jgi:hypothetical protein
VDLHEPNKTHISYDRYRGDLSFNKCRGIQPRNPLKIRNGFDERAPRNHQRHVPVVTVKGSEVRLTYGPELEWAKSSAHDDVARMDALDCLKADYAALKADPKHQLQDYFHVINYSMWSHQVIGEATVNRSDYPSAEAVDEEIARTLAEWQRRATAVRPGEKRVPFLVSVRARALPAE